MKRGNAILSALIIVIALFGAIIMFVNFVSIDGCKELAYEKNLTFYAMDKGNCIFVDEHGNKLYFVSNDINDTK